MATPPPNELAALIERIQAAAQQDAWETIRSLLKKEVLLRIHEVLDGLSEDDSEPDAGLAEKVERTFWRDVWPERMELPRNPVEFAQQVAQKAIERANHLAGEYQHLRRLLAKCKPAIHLHLLEALGAGDEDRAKALENQVHKRLWDLRHRLKQDCSGFNAQVGDTTREIGRHSVLFSKAASGDAQAKEEVFTEFRECMLMACRRAYPEIPEHDREDILHNAMVSVLVKISAALDPEQISTWRAFLRTVVVRAGRKWRMENRRFVLESELGAGNRG